MGSRGIRSCVAAALLVGAAAAVPARAAAPASPQPVSCPLKPSATFPGGQAWAFTLNARPSGGGSVSSYAHGRGTWTGGRGRGTICRQDSATGKPSHEIVLSVRGAARISPGITQGGRRGAAIALGVAVAASDDPACHAGTTGSVTIFASYYQGHHDTVRFAFGAACGSYDAAYGSSGVTALIADEGRQVGH